MNLSAVYVDKFLLSVIDKIGLSKYEDGSFTLEILSEDKSWSIKESGASPPFALKEQYSRKFQLALAAAKNAGGNDEEAMAAARAAYRAATDATPSGPCCVGIRDELDFVCEDVLHRSLGCHFSANAHATAIHKLQLLLRPMLATGGGGKKARAEDAVVDVDLVDGSESDDDDMTPADRKRMRLEKVRFGHVTFTCCCAVVLDCCSPHL